MNDVIKLVLDYKNPNWSDDWNYVEYFAKFTATYLMDRLRYKGFISKEEIYSNFGFDFGDRENKIYFYGLNAEYLNELNCSYISTKVTKGFSFDAGQIYLIEIEMEGPN